MLESKKKRKASSDDANGSSEMAMTVVDISKPNGIAGPRPSQVAEMLRIHCSYLQAIEEGEIDQLRVQHAVGFVRAYADHLGLDGNKVAERFKEEEVPKQRAQLNLPSPLPEGQIPGLAVLQKVQQLCANRLRRLGVRIFPDRGIAKWYRAFRSICCIGRRQ